MHHRTIKCSLLTLLIASLLLFFCGCSLSTFAQTAGSDRFEAKCGHSESTEIIYVSDLGWHTGIILPRAKVTGALRNIIDNIAPFQFVEIGWGDREFYLSSGYSYWKALRASFFSDGSVLHIAGFDEQPQEFFSSGTLARVKIGADGFKNLQQFIYQSIAAKKTEPTPMKASLYGNGGFIEANGNFSILNTCNTWTAKALARSGCRMPGTVIRASSVIEALKGQPLTPQK